MGPLKLAQYYFRGTEFELQVNAFPGNVHACRNDPTAYIASEITLLASESPVLTYSRPEK